ncbi:conserved hypothetical protein [Frankia sp. Hr75.2]|nr:conserved hypothetical protein [Frankia sp. Hr75.2]
MTGTESLNGQRLPRQTEAAAYFACLEAMQNAAKHAPGAAVCVDIGLADGVLSFTVSDDGPGFDPAAPEGGGTGLLGDGGPGGRGGGRPEHPLGAWKRHHGFREATRVPLTSLVRRIRRHHSPAVSAHSPL